MSDPLSTSTHQPEQPPSGEPSARNGAQSVAKDETRERTQGFLSTLLWAFVIALLVRTFLFQPFHIPSESMRPTLEAGDYVISTKWAYGYSRYSAPYAPDVLKGRVFEQLPERGDVVVFRAPHLGDRTYIKRAVGLPGDVIELREGVLVVNGEAVPRGLVGEDVRLNQAGEMRRYDVYEEILPGGTAYEVLDAGPGDLDDFGPLTVPAGHVFTLGDNRDESRDSRVPAPLGPGPVPVEALVGRADLVLLSARADFSLWRPWTWYRLRSDRFLRSLDPAPA